MPSPSGVIFDRAIRLGYRGVMEMRTTEGLEVSEADSDATSAGSGDSGRPTRPPTLTHFGDVASRIALTVSCTDTDELPRVPGAGDIELVDGTPVQVMHNGVLIERDSYCGAWMTEIIRCLRGFHEPQEEIVFSRILDRIATSEDSPSMIELGCWWSFYSLWFRKVLPTSRVVAVEPDPIYLDTARRNFALNHEAADLVHAGIAAGGSPTFVFEASSDGQTYEVPQYDLGQLLEMHDVDRVTLLLADIQGAETALIEGAREDLAQGRVRFLVVSTHHHSISGNPMTHQHVLASLQAVGGHVIAEHSVGESFSGDGLIAVSFDARDRDFTVPVSRARYRDSLFGELEPELAAALHRADRAESAAAESTRSEHRLAERLAEVEEELGDTRNAIAAVERSRIWRWSRRLRHFRSLIESSVRSGPHSACAPD
jgi:FkbM family methyltransferase